MGNPLRIPQRTASPKHAWVTKPEGSREQVGTGGTGVGKAAGSTRPFLHFLTHSAVTSLYSAARVWTHLHPPQPVSSKSAGRWLGEGVLDRNARQRVPWERCSLGGDFVSWHEPATTERGWSGRLGVRLAPSGWVSLTEHARRHGTGNTDRVTQWGYICAPVLLGLGSPLTQEKRDPFLHKKTLFRKVRALSVSDGETETPSGGPSWGFPTRAPCLLRFPTSLPTSHRSPGLTQASGPGLGPPRRRGTGGERRRRRGSGVGRRLPRAAVGGLFRGEEPARGRIAPRRRLPAPVPPPVLPPRRPRSHARRRPSFLFEHGARPAVPPARLASPR